MRIIGIHDGHNAAVCMLENGSVTAALQEERLTRRKNHDTFPSRALAWLLDQTGADMASVDAVAFNGAHIPVHRDRARLIRDVRTAGNPSPGRLARRYSDLWLTQWPHLAGPAGPAFHGGLL